MKIPIYCINLARSKDRRKNMEARAHKIGLHLEFIDAIDGLNFKHVCEFKHYDANKRLRFFKNHLNVFHLATMESFRKAFNVFLNSQEDHCVILEDDLIFAENFVQGIEAIMRAPPIWDVVRLYKPSRHPPNKMPFAINLSADPSMSSGWNLRLGTHLNARAAANIYTRMGAQKVLDLTERYYLAIDRHIIHGWQKKIAIYEIPPIIFLGKNQLQTTTKEKEKGARSHDLGKNDKAKKWFNLYHSVMKKLWSYRLILRGLRYKFFPAKN